MGSLGWIVSIVGVLGVAGTVALLVFSPAIAAQALAGAVKILNLILSTRIGVGCLVGALALLAGELHGEYRGSERVHAEWNEARKVAAAEKAKLEKDVAEKAAAKERADIESEREQDRKAIGDLNAYVEKLKRGAAGCGCDLDGDDVKWLQPR